MSQILLNLEASDLALLDQLLEERLKLYSLPAKDRVPVEIFQKAHEIAKRRGAVAANIFLAPYTDRLRKPTRTSLVRELLRKGLEEALSIEKEPPQVKETPLEKWDSELAALNNKPPADKRTRRTPSKSTA